MGVYIVESPSVVGGVNTDQLTQIITYLITQRKATLICCYHQDLISILIVSTDLSHQSTFLNLVDRTRAMKDEVNTADGMKSFHLLTDSHFDCFIC